MKNKKTGVTMCIINGKGKMIHEEKIDRILNYYL